MKEPNTLFLIAKYGLKPTDLISVLESHMWLLDSKEASMEYVSFHKSKTARAFKGGKIINIRDATEAEIAEHQQMIKDKGDAEMKVIEGRKIIELELDRKWKVLWPKNAIKGQMAYKSMAMIERP